jgi:hypothetical protein
MTNTYVPAPAVELGSETIKYLGDLASESYKRQAELDESVWRSLPFFAATFAFVATIIGRSASDLPPLEWEWYPAAPTVLLVLSVASLAWSLRWFWVVLKPREYEYPAPDDEVRQFAQLTAEFHVASGVSASDLDVRTLRDMRLLMIDQYGSAAATNLRHNAVKLKARPKVLLFMLLGFVLAFACEATIFVHTHTVGETAAQGKIPDDTSSTPDGANVATASGQFAAPAANAAQVAAGEGRRRILGRELKAGNQEQAMSRGCSPTPPQAPNGAAQQRPTPPSPQVVMKDRASTVANNRGSKDVPVHRKD